MIEDFTAGKNTVEDNATEEAVVTFEQAGITLGDFTLQDISFTIPKGYLIGLTGNNNAGKSTIMRMMMGSYTQYTGSIKVAGLEVKKQNRKTLDYLGYVAADNTFFMDRSPDENAEIYNEYYTEWDMDLYEQMLKWLDISRGIALNKLSKGNFIKFQLAFALAHRPKLLLLDEPTTGLDPVFRKEFLQLLQDVICTEQCSVLLATHLNSDLERISDYTIEIIGNTVIWKET